MEKPIRTTAPAVSLICLLLFQATLSFSQFSVHGDFKALPANPPELDQHAVPWLPFEEDWSSGLFETNHWDEEQSPNWRIAGQAGNSAPSAEFYYSPPVTNYQKALTSRLLNARNLIDGGIFLSFDLRLTSVNPTGLEFMKVQILTDSAWITVWADSNSTSFDWVNKKLNITSTVKGNAFRFRFLAEGQNSLDIFNWLIDNISVYRECAPPLNLHASVNFPNLDEILLEWDSPIGGGSGNSAWIGWDNGTNHDAIGLTDGGTFSVAVRFTPAQLNQYIGNHLTKIRLFPYAPGSFVLKVWTGANAGQQVLEQPIDGLVIGEWNEVELDSPVYVSGTTELWFGYTVTQASDLFPAGIDAGPAVAGFGDMISLDGYVWESMATAYALNFNWNLHGFLQTTEGAVKVLSLQQSSNGDANNKSGTPFMKNSHDGNRELLHYDIYDSYNYPDTYLGSTVETFYLDEIQLGYIHCYTVRAIYQDCTSGPSNEHCIIFESPKKNRLITCYPVPADQTLNIESENELTSLIITNFNYQPVYQTYNLKPGTLTINTSSFRNGMYMIRAIDASGSISTGKFVVNH
jgi:hypothetical protein